MGTKGVANNARTWDVTLPTGETIRVHNLKDWCERQGINAKHLGKVAQGKRRIHKGITLKLAEEQQPPKRVRGTRPTAPQVAPRAHPARENNKRSEETIAKHRAAISHTYRIVDPSGIVYEAVVGLVDFCAAHGLSRSSMTQLANGKLNKDNYFGWKVTRTKHPRK